MDQEKIHIYFMPGMAANPSIFENIKLPADIFEIHLLEWILPIKNESLHAYAKRMAEKVTHKTPVLVGVSFGGMLVQEMASFLNPQKVIIISSVKSDTELPKKMIFARYTKVHKILPTSLVNNFELLAKYAFGENVTKRLELYEKFLSVRDKYYLDWAIDQIVNWKRPEPIENLIHIHGKKDNVFPASHIKDCIVVEEGTHAMIIYRYKWFNENLPKIILSS